MSKKKPFEVVRYIKRNVITDGVYGRCQVISGPMQEHFGDAQFMFYMHGRGTDRVPPQVLLFDLTLDRPREIGVCSPRAFKEDFKILKGMN